MRSPAAEASPATDDPPPPADGSATGSDAPSPSAATRPPAALDDDEAVLLQLPDLPTDYLVGLLSLYQRLGNQAMADSVGEELRRRDPSGDATRAALSSLPDAPGHDTASSSPFDSVEDHADRLIELGRPNDAIALLEESRAGMARGGAFPLEGQLGSAYLAAGRRGDAVAAFQRVAQSSAYPESVRNEARRELAAMQRSDRLAEGYDRLVAGDHRSALALARELSAAHPADAEIRLLLGQSLTAAGLHREALAVLEPLRQATPAGATFIGQAAYADALYNNARFDEARDAYLELAGDERQAADLRMEAVATAREIRQHTADQTGVYTEYVNEAEGDRGLLEVDSSARVNERMRVGATAWYDYVALSDERSIRRDSGSTTGAYAWLRSRVGDHHFLETQAGGADYGEVLYGFSIGRHAANDTRWGWQAAFQANQPATDSQQLIALGGRQDVVSADVGGPLPLGLKLRGRLGGRRVLTDGAELGDGAFTELELGRTIWHHKPSRRSLYLAYQATWENFDARQLSAGEIRSLDLFDPAGGARFGNDLIEEEFHPHGLLLVLDHRFSDRVGSYLGVGVNYDFADDEVDWYVNAGLSFLVIDDLELVLETGYYSDGTAANDASAVVVANLGFRYFY